MLKWTKEVIFSRGHATLELAVSVGRSVRQIFDSRVVFALPLLPNRPRLDCRVSGLVFNLRRFLAFFEVRPLEAELFYGIER